MNAIITTSNSITSTSFAVFKWNATVAFNSKDRQWLE